MKIKSPAEFANFYGGKNRGELEKSNLQPSFKKLFEVVKKKDHLLPIIIYVAAMDEDGESNYDKTEFFARYGGEQLHFHFRDLCFQFMEYSMKNNEVVTPEQVKKGAISLAEFAFRTPEALNALKNR